MKPGCPAGVSSDVRAVLTTVAVAAVGVGVAVILAGSGGGSNGSGALVAKPASARGGASCAVTQILSTPGEHSIDPALAPVAGKLQRAPFDRSRHQHLGSHRVAVGGALEVGAGGNLRVGITPADSHVKVDVTGREDTLARARIRLGEDVFIVVDPPEENGDEYLVLWLNCRG